MSRKRHKQTAQPQAGEFREALAELAADMIQGGTWSRLTGTYEARDFDLMARSSIRELVYAFWMKNPLISRAVEIENNYVFGRGVTVSSAVDMLGQLLASFWTDPDNLVELTGFQAQQKKNLDLKLFGNVYLAVVTNPTTGRVKVRSFPDHEITDVVYHPDDRRKVLLYQRKWTPTKFDFDSGTYLPGDPQVEYVLDFRAKAADMVGLGIPIRQVRQNVRIYHVKVNCVTEAKFGNSEIYRAVDWAKAYNRFLEDWATVVASLSKFAFKQTIKQGGPGAIASSQTRWEQLAAQGGPPAGSTFVQGAGTDLAPMPKGGPDVKAEDGRRLLLMVAAATGIMEHYFGDPSTGNLATSTAMELPMLKQFEGRQQLWWDVLTDLVDYVIEASARAPAGYLARQGARIQLDEASGREVVVLPAVTVEKEGPDGKVAKTSEVPSIDYDVAFPSIVQQDVQVQSAALASIASAGALPEKELVRQAARLLGIQDVDALLEEWEKEKAAKAALAAEIAKNGGPMASAAKAKQDDDEGDPEEDPLGAKAREAFIQTLQILHDQLLEAGRVA